MPDILVECRNLGRELSPSGQFLIREISFGVAPGEVLGIVGPSGAGKSTLLRLVNRLDEPTEGTVFFHSRNYRELAPEALCRSVGMVMQRAYLFPGTVAENIAFGPRQHGTAITPTQIEALLAEVGLEGYAGRDALTLSGGEAQRVAITRGLANDPEVLLLDEPTSALDESSRESVEQLIERLIRERHLTCLWVTHSPEQARSMAHRVLVVEGGRMKAIGTPEEVLSKRIEAADV
jgi:putative ABC transport system ATP-binding protein